MFLSKHCLWCVAWVLCLTVACIGVGCGNGDDIVTETETEQVTEVTETEQVIARFDGEHIIFEQGGTIYEGRVVEGVSEDEVRVRLVDGSEKVVGVNDIAGTLIADHPDIGIEVVLDGDQDKGEQLLTGKIVKGYSNGYRKIEIFKVQFLDGRVKVLEVSRIRFVHEDTSFLEDGGYMTLEEFEEFMIGLR